MCIFSHKILVGQFNMRQRSWHCNYRATPKKEEDFNLIFAMEVGNWNLCTIRLHPIRDPVWCNIHK